MTCEIYSDSQMSFAGLMWCTSIEASWVPAMCTTLGQNISLMLRPPTQVPHVHGDHAGLMIAELLDLDAAPALFA